MHAGHSADHRRHAGSGHAHQLETAAGDFCKLYAGLQYQGRLRAFAAACAAPSQEQICFPRAGRVCEGYQHGADACGGWRHIAGYLRGHQCHSGHPWRRRRLRRADCFCALPPVDLLRVLHLGPMERLPGVSAGFSTLNLGIPGLLQRYLGRVLPDAAAVHLLYG